MTRALRHSTWSLWLVAAALVLRMLVAPGFMPVVSTEAFTVKICGQPGVTFQIPGKPDAPMPKQGDCVFAGIGALANYSAAPVFAAPPSQLFEEALPPPSVATPHIGAPAPPPPPTGPPLLA